MNKIGRICVGLGLVVIGIIGIIMPIMPGWSLLVPGLVILEAHIPPVRHLLDWTERQATLLAARFPRFSKQTLWCRDTLAWARRQADTAKAT